MNRRKFIAGSLAAGVAAGAGEVFAESQLSDRFLTIEWYRCRRDLDVARLRSFLGEALLPAYDRAGIKPVGAFQVSVGPDSPSLLIVAPFASISGVQETRAKMASDEKWMKDLRTFDEKKELAYERLESSLLRSFKSFPQLEQPKLEEGKPHVFELRVYESPNLSLHERKVQMFNSGEVDIFRRCGIQPVFFGSTIFGTRIPNLAYMVGFPSWESRAEGWAKFGQDPEWRKLSTNPIYAERETVVVISNQILSALPFSQIK